MNEINNLSNRTNRNRPIERLTELAFMTAPLTTRPEVTYKAQIDGLTIANVPENTQMITFNFAGNIKLNFEDGAAAAKWFEQKELAALETAKKTKAAKEAIRLRAAASTYAEFAALLRSATIEPNRAAA